jgi:hypothetical protein
MSEESIYVVVAENDQPVRFGERVFHDDGGPLVFEQYTRHASLKQIRERAKQLSATYGKCRIARLQFIEEVG